jgi:DNA-binding NtrC family response regulator
MWDGFAPESLLSTSPQLVIAHATPHVERVKRFFDWLRRNPIQVPILAILTESPDPELLRTVTEVVDDFLFCPSRDEEMKLRINRILESQSSVQDQIRCVLGDEMGLAKLVGRHPSFRHAVEQAALFSANEAPVLITGETGTGKELFAHAIHSLSPRRNGPFIPVDCGILPEHLAENELFGHRRGAFTDAHSDQEGLVGMAKGGTLFLDEIDSLSLVNQSKLLRFLQEGTFRPLGSERFAHANIRIIAATNREVEECVRQRQFRSDLYFRLNVLRLQLPPLRDRRGDVAVLARHFIENECAAGGHERKVLSVAALRKLESYYWPGNVRQLFNVVQRACIATKHQIMPCHIFLAGDAPDHQIDASQKDFRTAKQQLIAQFERDYVEELMTRHHGNVTQAARDAGKERRAFGRLVKKYGIPGPSMDARSRAGHS